ncbi:unnamed protein product [Lactuca saligna]|uniref:Uncharacterized protein n=1 Tax=Lactuca saligna TaxID=75948 RepID=A0AA36E2L3_LACSI|nr:unnamed protein product [Lactuca saligna]
MNIGKSRGRKTSWENGPNNRLRRRGSGPASSSQPVVGAIFPGCFPTSAFADIHVMGQAGKGTTPIRKKRSVRMVLSSEEEIESDDVSLHRRKMQNMVSVPNLLGDIGDVLGDGFSAMSIMFPTNYFSPISLFNTVHLVVSGVLLL